MDDKCAFSDCPRVIEVWDAVRQHGAVAVQTYRFGLGEVPDLVSIPANELLGWMSRTDYQRFADQLALQVPPASYADLLRGAHRNLLRLETRPEYDVAAEREMLAAFRAGLPQPEPSPDARAWVAATRQDVEAGVRHQRVRLVGEPRTAYEEWEIVHAYRLLVEAGEDILIAERGANMEWNQDFYLLDGRVAVLVHYNEDGRLLSGWRTDDPDIVHACRVAYERAFAAAVPLDQYLERTARTEMAG